MEDQEENQLSDQSLGRHGEVASSQDRSENYVHESSVNNEEEKKRPVLEKLVVRLKNGSPKVGDDLDNAEATTTITKLHVCQVCKKGFSSGKALGGHAKMHQQPTKEKLLKKIKNHPAELVGRDCNGNGGDWMGESSTSTEATCRVCKKEFPSMKSLFGHMRSHPERQWRGVHPPSPSFQTSSLSMVSETADQVTPTQENIGLGLGQDIDLLESLPHWGITDQRGRAQKRKRDATASSSCLKEEKRGKHKLNIDEEICDGLLAMKNSKIRYKIEACSNETVVNKDSLTKPRGRYVCNYKDCYRSFSTHQALGGHRSSHSRDYQNNRRAMEVVTSSPVDHEGEIGSSSGQSFEGPIEESPSREEAFPVEDDGTGSRALKLDLNKEPELTDDEIAN